jgi:uncharacterized protein YecE (DUF72 family)
VRYLVGTSGWQYVHWRGVLYPDRLPQRRWLATYAAEFGTVEVNNAFYRLPSREVFARWREQIPAGFVMAVKASRYLTHITRMADPAEPVKRLMDHAAGLADRLGPVLLQLPPSLPVAPDRLAACLDAFPSGIRIAVEPRHDSWWTDEIRELLARRGAALCWADRDGHPITPLWRTADWAYLRLHHGTADPWPRYARETLQAWADRLAETWPDGEAYVYFNNDPGGAAIYDARAFRALTG